jgi:autotransporter-associated beta strand protein/VCBS repeat-containing protein
VTITADEARLRRDGTMADATWLLTPTSGDWNTAANWSPAAVPDGMANFGATNNSTLTIAANTSIGALVFAAGGPPFTFYTFKIAGPQNPTSPSFDIVGAGILNSSAVIPRFTIGGGSSLTAGTLQFHNSSSAGNANLFVDSSSTLHFWDLSTADQATINIGGSFSNFLAAAVFHDTSKAGSATITLGFDTSLSFVGSSSADSATIDNPSQLSFDDSSTAGSAWIKTSNPFGNGRVDFNDDASAGSALLTTAGGTIAFHDNSSPGQAHFDNDGSSAIVDFSDTSGPGGLHQLTAGGIEGDGFFRLGSNTLTVGSNDLTTSVNGVISDGGIAGGTGGALTKTGSGTLTLLGANTYTGATTVSAGTLLVNGSIASATTVGSGATFGGWGTVSATSVSNGGTLAPGPIVGTHGTLSTQALSLVAGATLDIEIFSSNQFDRVNVTGSVSLGGATLDASLPGGFNPATGAAFVIVDNDGTDPISGTFAGLPEGAIVTAGANRFSITYHGGTNANDVVLTSLNEAPVASNGSASGTSNDTITGQLIASDVDTFTLAYALVSQAAHGTVTVNPDGTFSYVPAATFTGADSFTFKANDGALDSNVATVSLTVNIRQFGGSGGDDSFNVPTGVAQVNGGLGVDTATFSFRLVDATVTYSGNQTIIDTALSHTVLTGVEVFVFTDGTVNNNDADPLVDDLFYYSHYHDIWTAHVDADQHYHQSGWREGRDPSAFFSTQIYLAAYRDVAAAGVDPLVHFDQSGWREGRVPSTAFDPAKYLAANPDVAAARIDPLAHFLASGAQEGRQPFPGTVIAGNGFDYAYYLQHNPDVAAAGVDPLQHFQTVGWKEGRNPNALFDTSGYLATYTDVKNAGVNPLDHYHSFGWHEGRDPSVNFDTTDYLGHYPDVAAAQADPLLHFLRFGAFEGRSAFPDGVWG